MSLCLTTSDWNKSRVHLRTRFWRSNFGKVIIKFLTLYHKVDRFLSQVPLQAIQAVLMLFKTTFKKKREGISTVNWGTLLGYYFEWFEAVNFREGTVIFRQIRVSPSHTYTCGFWPLIFLGGLFWLMNPFYNSLLFKWLVNLQKRFYGHQDENKTKYLCVWAFMISASSKTWVMGQSPPCLGLKRYWLC